MGHGPWMSLPVWGFGLAPKSFRSFCRNGGILYSASGVPPKEGFQRRALGPGDYKTQTRVRIERLGAWKAPYAGSWSSPREALLEHGAHDEGHNACFCGRRPSSMGVASWAMQVSPTLKGGHHANSKVSWMGMDEF